MAHDLSPTARALLALAVIQNSPGITAYRLGERLGVTERAARRYIAILREAGLPIESVSGPHGGYRVGRSLRLAPLMFTAAEAMGLVMAVLEGHRDAADPTDLVGSALAKILQVLPERVASPVRAFRGLCAPRPAPGTRASQELTAQLIEACSAARRLRLAYRTGQAADRVMEVDPWAVVLRHSRWYLLCWSHTRQAQRVLRVDRIVTTEILPDTFTPPASLDALRTLEDHLSAGRTHPVDVLIDATLDETPRWVPRSLGRLEADGESRTRLRATTDDPDWYARQLAAIPAPFQVVGSPELQRATVDLAQRLIRAGSRDEGLDTMQLPTAPDAVAPDGSDVRVLLRLSGGSMAHFELRAGRVSRAVAHHSVQEIWYILRGHGQMWRRQAGRQEIVPLEPGTCVSIPAGTHFQFRAAAGGPLAALGVTMPPWPGADEAYQVPGVWPAEPHSAGGGPADR